MVSPREGHTSGVRDLFFRTHLSNAAVQLVVQSSLLVEETFSLSLMHIPVTFSWGISLGFPGKETRKNMLQTQNTAARLGRQDIPALIDVATWYFSLSSGSEFPLKTEL